MPEGFESFMQSRRKQAGTANNFDSFMQKRKSAEEILGITTPKGAPPKRRSAEEILGISASAPTAPTVEPPGFLENIGIGAKREFINYIANPSLAASEALASLTTGNFEPAKQLLELVGRGAFQTLTEPLVKDQPSISDQSQQIAAIKQQQSKRRAQIPTFQTASRASQELEQRAAADPSLSGKITRGVAGGVVAAVPLVAAGIASGGSLPAMAGVAAAQSLGQPENLALNVAAGAVPVPVGKLVAPILRRIRGAKGVAAETREAAATAASLPEYQPPTELPTLEADLVTATTTPASASSRAQAAMRGPSPETAALDIGANSSLVSLAERTPILETLSAFRKAGLLTGIKTHIKNLGGNLGFALSEEATRIPAAIADLVVSPITGRRTITGPSLPAMGRSAWEAVTKGRREAWEIIKNGVSEADAARLELKELKSGSKVLNTYVKYVFRTLNAEDKVFSTYAYRRSLEDRARSIALTEIRAGEITRGQYGQRVRELIDQPPAALDTAAIADAEVATFTEPNRLAEAITAGKEKLPALGRFGVRSSSAFY